MNTLYGITYFMYFHNFLRIGIYAHILKTLIALDLKLHRNFNSTLLPLQMKISMKKPWIIIRYTQEYK